MTGREEATVRPARADDYESACWLLDLLDAHHRMRLPWMFMAPSQQFRTASHFARQLDDPNSTVMVAEASDVVGVGIGLIRRAPDLPIFVQQRWAVLDSLVVDAAWRRRGIGKLLARSIAQWGLQRGAAWVEVNVYEANPEARGFYDALGYQPLTSKLRLDFGAGSEQPQSGLELAPDGDSPRRRSRRSASGAGEGLDADSSSPISKRDREE